MRDELNGHRPEIQLCVGLSRPDLNSSVGASWREYVHENLASIDWAAFFALCAKHKVLPLVAKNVQAHNIHRANSGEPVIPWAWVYEGAYRANCSRGEAMVDLCREVLPALERREVQYALRKGLVSSEWLYGDIAARRMNDIDLLISREEMGAAADVLIDYGYSQGRLDHSGRTIVPYDRETRIMWRLTVDNALPFARLTGIPNLPFVQIDVAHALFHPAKGDSLDAAPLLARRVRTRVAGLDAFTLNEVDFFLDICTHFHKEASRDYYIAQDKHLLISKFLDVALASGAISSSSTWAAVAARASHLKVGSSVYFALHHASLLYPDLVGGELVAMFEPYEDLTRLINGHSTKEGKEAIWPEGVLERMFPAASGATPQRSIS